MPNRPPRRCPRCGKPTVGRCARCHAQTRRLADSKRGNATDRGYGGEHRARFRAAVLRRDPVCVLCRRAESTVADHHPLSRRELLAAGLDPNDPQHGRGLCKPCHDKWTSTAQPGFRFGQDR